MMLMLKLMLVLTFPLQKQPEEGAGSGDGFLVVVIIVDGQQVTVHISVAHQQLHVGDVVDMLEKAVELIEATWFGPIQREATKLCPKLGQTHRKRKKEDRHISQELDLLHLQGSVRDPTSFQPKQQAGSHSFHQNQDPFQLKA